MSVLNSAHRKLIFIFVVCTVLFSISAYADPECMRQVKQFVDNFEAELGIGVREPGKESILQGLRSPAELGSAAEVKQELNAILNRMVHVSDGRERAALQTHHEALMARSKELEVAATKAAEEEVLAAKTVLLPAGERDALFLDMRNPKSLRNVEEVDAELGKLNQARGPNDMATRKAALDKAEAALIERKREIREAEHVAKVPVPSPGVLKKNEDFLVRQRALQDKLKGTQLSGDDLFISFEHPEHDGRQTAKIIGVTRSDDSTWLEVLWMKLDRSVESRILSYEEIKSAAVSISAKERFAKHPPPFSISKVIIKDVPSPIALPKQDEPFLLNRRPGEPSSIPRLRGRIISEEGDYIIVETVQEGEDGIIRRIKKFKKEELAKRMDSSSEGKQRAEEAFNKWAPLVPDASAIQATAKNLKRGQAVVVRIRNNGQILEGTVNELETEGWVWKNVTKIRIGTEEVPIGNIQYIFPLP